MDASRLRGYVIISAMWLAVLGVALYATRRPSGEPIEIIPPPTPAPTSVPTATRTPAPIFVDVVGAVRVPGVYALPAGSLVQDAINAAGGPAADADLNRINKAVRVQDGAQVYVRRVAETPPPPPMALEAPAPTPGGSAGGRSSAVNVLVDINTAGTAELEELPGIGPALAARIIEGRPYASVEDLLRVRGIGEATLAKLRPLVTVN